MSSEPEWKIRREFQEIVSDDERGWMCKEIFADKVIWLIYTRKGFGRGGEIHPVTQHVSVVSGSVEFSLRWGEHHEIVQIVKAGEHIEIPKDVAHVGIALENSIMIEWHDGELPSFKDKQIYEPYRKLIFGEKK